MPQEEEADENRAMRHAAYRQFVLGTSVNLVKVTGVLFRAIGHGRYVINIGILLIYTLVFIHLRFRKYIKYNKQA